MTALKMVLPAKKTALRFFLGKYFSVLAGEFASPYYVNQRAAYG